MKNKYFIYLSEPLSSTIIESQVVNLLELLQTKNIIFDLFLTNPLSMLFRNEHGYTGRIKRAQANLKGKVFLVPALRKKKIAGISFLIEFLYLICIILNKSFNKREIFIQTRNLDKYSILKIIKLLFPKTIIIFDYRGAIAEEFINKNGIKSINDKTDKKIQKEYRFYLRAQNKMLELADKIVCVSKKLKNYAEKYIENKSLYVIPGSADSSLFRFEAGIRKELRDKLKLNERIVLVYSGRLVSTYQMSEFMFSAIKNLFIKNNRISFLCLTPDTGKGEDLIRRNNLDMNRIVLKYVNYTELWQYYNAADIGLLLREDIVTNNLASPTKFSEYLLCGLPVLISENVGDFSDFIAVNNFGCVIKNTSKNMLLGIDKLIKMPVTNRKNISKISAKFYSKQENLSKYIDIYSG